MHGHQIRAHILRRTPWTRPNRLAQPPGLIMEEIGIMRSRQRLQESGHGLGQAVVELVAASPERVPPRRRQGVDFQHGEVGGDVFEGDVRVPAGRGETAAVAELHGEAAAFLLLGGADDGDLVAEFAGFFGERVDVEA